MNENRFVFYGEKVKARRIGVKITEYYKSAFLAIFNNVRISKELLTVENDYNDTVYVVCLEEADKDCREWLEQFGEVWYDEPCDAYIMDEPDYNYETDDEPVVVIER